MVRGKKECRRGNFIRLADPAHRDQGYELILDFLWNSDEDAGVDGARTQDIHANLSGLQINSPSARERANGSLARIVNAPAPKTFHTRDGAGHDDPPTVPHEWQSRLV